MTSGIFDTTVAGVPSRAVVYAKLMNHLRESQELAALLAHLHGTESNDMDRLLQKGWLGISEMFKLTQKHITDMAMRKLS